MYDGYVDQISRHAVQGWAVNMTRTDQSIDILIVVDGREVSRVTANLPRPDVAAKRNLTSALHGFAAPIPGFLDTTGPHQVQVKFADSQQLISNGERSFSRLDDIDVAPALAARRMIALSPVFLTHMPRSGSTLCMGLLHRHPSIIVAEHYPFEVKPATYYARAARLLTEPGNHAESASPTEFMRSSVNLGFNPFFHLAFDPVFKDGQLRDHFFERSARIALFNTLRSISIDYYHHLAVDQLKHTATYFAEKCEVQSGTRRSLLSLFPEAREILLIRDPRDLLCSTLSYFKETMREDLLRNLQNGCETTRLIASSQRQHTLVVKYEELVFNQPAALKAIATFLDIDAAAWSNLGAFAPTIIKKHATSESPQKSIGRWKKELTTAQKETCAASFSKYLADFGYDQPPSQTKAATFARPATRK